MKVNQKKKTNKKQGKKVKGESNNFFDEHFQQTTENKTIMLMFHLYSIVQNLFIYCEKFESLFSGAQIQLSN